MSESNPTQVYQHISIALLVALAFLIFYIAFNSTKNTGINFGDDSNAFANNGQCSDTRFRGEGMGNITLNEIANDASDCSTLYNDGKIFLSSEPARMLAAAIDFGDDLGDWPLDEECDDPRFTGTGLAFSASRDDIRHDATDCRNLLYQGMVYLVGEIGNESADGIDFDNDIGFGDDLSDWANDGECDDLRFGGSGMATTLLDEDAMHDATDCQNLYAAEEIIFIGDILASGGNVERGVLEIGDEILEESGAFVDSYYFEGALNQAVIFDLRSSDFDTYLIINAPDGEQFESDDYQGDMSRSLLTQDLNMPGTYEVLVTSYSSGETGSYILGIITQDSLE